MKCHYCEEDIPIGDDYVYLDIDNGLCFHDECADVFIHNITYIKTNDKDDFEN